MRSEPDPQWLREAWRGFVHEWTSYGRTALAVTRSPGRFMREWADGERAALNPLACALNLIAIVTTLNVVVLLGRHLSDDTPAWVELFAPALQLLNTSLIASMVHFPLRLFGARRGWSTTMASALFVTSGPLLPLYVARNAVWPTKQLILAHRQEAVPLGALILGVMVVYLVLTLSAAHRVSWWRVLVAFVLGMALVVGIALAAERLHLTFSF